tara:strand:+ start:532 stop:1596 length:1065 start_codon:yes stop_codon:yes gene_type:complete
MVRDQFRWSAISFSRRLLRQRIARTEWEALSAWRGLVHQAYQGQPIQPNLCSDLWHHSRFQNPSARKAFFTPNRREREASSHHYGHDIQLKRYAGIPLVGPPLPVLLEHGLKVSEGARFETPKAWAHRGYLCMGPLRARWLREQHQVPARAIGPWIQFAQPLLNSDQLKHQRQRWGKTLLVVLAHSWDQVERSMDQQACVDAVKTLAEERNYQQVVWLRHWKDPEFLPLPKHWISACNGHRSNPWFLDALRTLLELCDGVASNAFGTHLGYAAALNKQLHWIDVAAEQNLSHLSSDKAAEEDAEWQERQRLSTALQEALCMPPSRQQHAVQTLVEPYWGLSLKPTPADVKSWLI